MDLELFQYFCKTANYEYMPIMVTRESAKPTLEAVLDASNQTRTSDMVGDVLAGGVLGGGITAIPAAMVGSLGAEAVDHGISLARGPGAAAPGMVMGVARQALPLAVGAGLAVPAILGGAALGAGTLGGIGELIRRRREGRLQEWIDAKR